ncbi:MAG: MFS transporter [Rhizobiales bacterium]|nr:MFS transporter [Hyphomicrobiales bacterium]
MDNYSLKEKENIMGMLIPAIIMGRVSEFFGFFVYAIASVLVFPIVFFPNADPINALLMSFAVFSLAFIARPIGSVLFIMLDKIIGRSGKIILALLLLGVSTICIGFLPSYAEIGIAAPIALAILRFGQGLATGGSFSGLISAVARNAPKERRGWYSMFAQLGAPIGLILALVFFAVFKSILTAEEFINWGWRFTFIVVLALNVVSLFARMKLTNTEELQEIRKSMHLKPVPILDLFRKYGYWVWVGAYVPLASFALFHMVTVFPLGLVMLGDVMPLADFLIIEIVGAVIFATFVFISGLLADKIGREQLLLIAATLIALFSLFTGVIIQDDYSGITVFVLVGFAILGLSYGQTRGALAHHFDDVYRYTGAMVTSDIAWLFGAAFAPIIAFALTHYYGVQYAGYYLLSGALATIVALLLSRKKVKR